MTEKVINNRAKKLQEVRKEIKVLRRTAEKLAKDLKEELTARNTNSLVTDSFVITWNNRR